VGIADKPFWLWLCAVLPALAVASPASAGDDQAIPHAGQVVRCASEDMRRSYCPMQTDGGVDLVRQLSDTPCIRESDWGVEGDGIWVTRNCQGEFRARGHSSAVRRHVIRCESPSGRTRNCAVALRGAPVRLLRQLSSMPCKRDESWGVGRNQVWVGRGCKGEFEIGARDGSFPPGPRLLTCESRGGHRQACGTTIDDGVFLLKQMSSEVCEEGRNWGWSADGIWVDDGCRAEFAVQ